MSAFTRQVRTRFTRHATRTMRAALLVGAAAAIPATAAAQLRVVTSTTDLWDIAKAVGGSHITATHIGEGYEDPHFVQPKPSFILTLRRADVWAYVGLDLEIGWMSVLLDGAKNQKIRAGGAGHVNASTVIPVLDVMQGRVDRSMGDIHPLGNPHYWLHPDNATRIAELFQGKFTELDPANAAAYEQNRQAFQARLEAAAREWQADLAAIRDKPVVAWHTSWRYFAQYTGMRIVGFIEPKPGVPPSPAHLTSLIQTMKQTGVKVIIMEPFYDRKTADVVARQTGARVLILPPSVGGQKGLDDYIALMRHNIQTVAGAVR
ncbi:MAG TPA: metal ABC transporter substrate-binding protein [Gemmatimonadaceae bacterium]|nr:metal ABC transporter substrate-binding protein [Gemmatimonadaceae bacterium]